MRAERVMLFSACNCRFRAWQWFQATEGWYLLTDGAERGIEQLLKLFIPPINQRHHCISFEWHTRGFNCFLWLVPSHWIVNPCPQRNMKHKIARSIALYRLFACVPRASWMITIGICDRNSESIGANDYSPIRLGDSLQNATRLARSKANSFSSPVKRRIAGHTERQGIVGLWEEESWRDPFFWIILSVDLSP